MGTGSFPRLKRPGRGVNHPSHLAPWLKKERATWSDNKVRELIAVKCYIPHC